MISTAGIETRLQHLPCPICKKSVYTIDPRATTSYAEDLFTAICSGCRYRFQIGVPIIPMQQHDRDTANWLAELGCPSCRSRGVSFDFRCMPSVRESYYAVTCNACHTPFFEQSPMTAYE